MPTRAETIEDLKKLGLKTVGNQLKDLATAVLKLLSEAAGEASRLPDEQSRKAGLEWATVCGDNIRMYQNKLVLAMAERDPGAMWNAAANFGGLPRYVDDYDWSWFSRRSELDQLFTDLDNAATAIMVSIHTFDSASMESARKALS